MADFLAGKYRRRSGSRSCSLYKGFLSTFSRACAGRSGAPARARATLQAIIGIAPSKFVFTYCADALFNGSMSEGDAFKRLAIVCGLVVAMVVLPMAVKRFAAPRKGLNTEVTPTGRADVFAGARGVCRSCPRPNA